MNISIAQLFVFNIILITVIQFIVHSEQTSKTTSYGYVLFAMLLMTGSLLYSLNKAEYSIITVGVGISIMLILFITLYQFDNIGSSAHEQMGKYVTYFIGIAMVLVGLAMIYKGVANTIGNQTGIIGFIMNFIFFLPCLITDFVEYIKSEFNLTPPVVYILFAIEMFIILLFVAISHIPKITMNLGGTSIVNEALFLDSKYTFKNIGKKTDKLLQQMKGNNRYSISLWTYVNQRTHLSDRNVNIFAYGSDNSWKPQIQFKGADTYLVTLDSNVKHEIELPSQIWHNFVFNYNGDFIDLFVNGNLERTFKSTQAINYNETTDQFITGDDSGIYGAICNVTYYNEPLTLREITSAYNLLNGRNPPINNI